MQKERYTNIYPKWMHMLMTADEEPRTNLLSNALENRSGIKAKIYPESIVLLDMLHYAHSQGIFKQLCYSVIVLKTDEFASIFGEAMELDGTEIFLKTMQLFLASYKKFQSYIVTFLKNEEDVAKSIRQFSEINVKYLKRDVTAEQKFVECINQIQNLISRQDFVKHQRSKLKARAAKHFNFQFTFKADINTTLASHLLTAICLGRGITAALLSYVNLIDDRLNDGIKLVQPLRNLSNLEIDVYLKVSLKSLQCRYYGENKGTYGSLQNLTRSFIHNLQTNFSSTVSRGTYPSSGNTPSQLLVDADLKDQTVETTKRLTNGADGGVRSEINVKYLKRDVTADKKFLECISQIQNLISR
ncbi:hypothetical protein GQX74_005743, partial [Glossina fuscipes]